MIILSISSSSVAYGAGLGSLLSPGELSRDHAKYEGIKNCTLCHKIGGGVTDAKCLECHDKLAERINKNEGGHSKYTDICITCHIEHMGRGHKLVDLDEEKFKHRLTGYLLEGEHSKLLCSKCHRRQGVYGGLVKECISCHKDEHKKQLGRRCEKCHDPSGWKEVRSFSHNRDSAYILKGAHLDVECKECHVKGRFKPLKYETCGTSKCHGDQHKRQFKGQECEECHREDSSSWKVSSKKFSHDKAEYKLTGAHLKVKCKKCHEGGRFKPLDFKSCGTSNCHGKRHEDQFKGRGCEECHREDSSSWKVSSEFSHDKAEYKLTGKHLKVECKKCHERGRFKPLDFESCSASNCHGERHEDQFKEKRCEECHREDSSSWKVSKSFSHNRDSAFPLKGKHLDLECSKCHEKGRFKPIEHKGCGTSNCHGGEHGGEFKDKSCADCHDPAASGFEIEGFFDHGREADFPLTGGHSPDEVECKDCHSSKKFRSTGKGCYACHQDDDEHWKTLGKECERCHLSGDWIELDFDHDKDTKFRLSKEHYGLECNDCHIRQEYGDVSRNCFDCHIK